MSEPSKKKEKELESTFLKQSDFDQSLSIFYPDKAYRTDNFSFDFNQSLRIFSPDKAAIRENFFYVFPDQFFTIQPSQTEFDINKLNDLELLRLETRFTNKLINLILSEDFEYGVTSKSELLIREQLSTNASATKIWLNNIFLRNFNSPEIIIGILRIISRFSEEVFQPIGQTIAIAALAHKNVEVIETAIRIFENWGGLMSLEILSNVNISTEWLDDYKKNVIADLKSELCPS